MGKAPFSIGKIAPTPVLVDQYFNDSTGVGDEGETDARGPWNEGGDWEIVEADQLEEGVENLESDNVNEETNPSRQARPPGSNNQNTKTSLNLRSLQPGSILMWLPGSEEKFLKTQKAHLRH